LLLRQKMCPEYNNYGVLDLLYSTISETPELIERDSYSPQ
jgi:hypothetical protein